jgi:multicomponent Na+:H+ antiporter subunit E
VKRGLAAIMIGVALAALWWTLSGRTELFLLILGAASIVIVLVLLGRMRIIDDETAGVRRAISLLAYWVWLGGEIFKANLVVAREVVRIDLALSPRVVRIRARQHTDFGRAIFANSITLTPGTVTVDIDGGGFMVHALLDSMGDPSAFEAMDRRAALAAEGATSP